MSALHRFLRGLLGATLVTALLVATVVLGWGLGVVVADALGVDATAPVIACMLACLLALGLWMEPPDRFRWFFPRE